MLGINGEWPRERREKRRERERGGEREREKRLASVHRARVAGWKGRLVDDTWKIHSRSADGRSRVHMRALVYILLAMTVGPCSSHIICTPARAEYKRERERENGNTRLARARRIDVDGGGGRDPTDGGGANAMPRRCCAARARGQWRSIWKSADAAAGFSARGESASLPADARRNSSGAFTRIKSNAERERAEEGAQRVNPRRFCEGRERNFSELRRIGYRETRAGGRTLTTGCECQSGYAKTLGSYVKLFLCCIVLALLISGIFEKRNYFYEYANDNFYRSKMNFETSRIYSR